MRCILPENFSNTTSATSLSKRGVDLILVDYNTQRAIERFRFRLRTEYAHRTIEFALV
jgi:hypothetical protein